LPKGENDGKEKEKSNQEEKSHQEEKEIVAQHVTSVSRKRKAQERAFRFLYGPIIQSTALGQLPWPLHP